MAGPIAEMGHSLLIFNALANIDTLKKNYSCLPIRFKTAEK